MAEDPKFKNCNGRYLTQGLFLETLTRTEDRLFCVYTLKSQDYEDLPSLKRLYLEMEDVTEYEFATKYLYDFPHWEALCKSTTIREHIDQWRKELQLKLKARAMKMVIKDAAEGKYDANKFLVAGGWVEKPLTEGGKRGRPSKDEVAAKLAEESELHKIVNEDLKRLGLN